MRVQKTEILFFSVSIQIWKFQNYTVVKSEKPLENNKLNKNGDEFRK